ncbi:MAG: tetrahydrofolate dehydrogenase/cyclohydrolase catalytic domain-containing protein [Phascolarctobacterium sp.]|nr:tetrahydrofolate dehydrogenase/cyclohydrolase catalytic domain-containing protein [Phascolarctobacterium sp.]MEE1231499.1 tetrahydrofolate dehydrogenase/cyclohydrolase catalytic domain-containing protein [Phascolarctobacterium sp.]
METILMRGKPVADVYRETITEKIAAAKQRGLLVTLAIVVVGDDPASHVYKGRLVKLIESLGGAAKVIELPGDSSEEDVIGVVKKLNRNRYVTGILPMMPMPKHINGDAVGAAVSPNKDVDCLNPQNSGDVFMGRSKWAACTPRSCMAILEHYGIELDGKNVVVIGRSNVVGKPVAMLLLAKNATVTVCHSHTKELPELLKTADVIVAAVGKACFVKPKMVKEGVVIVDVGINAVGDKLMGDVDPAVAAKASAFTPVPGGVGVVSNMMVMECLTRNL